ncbi:unnamed protein product, partial [Ectocarpus sp. 12 AP-2014]
QSACGFRAWRAAGKAGGADFPGSGGIWPFPAPGAHRTPPANTPTPPGLLPAALWWGKKHEEQWCRAGFAGLVCGRVLGLFSNQERRERGEAVEQCTIKEWEGVAEKWLKPGPPAP